MIAIDPPSVMERKTGAGSKPQNTHEGVRLGAAA
jgi:hypothetical protein